MFSLLRPSFSASSFINPRRSLAVAVKYNKTYTLIKRYSSEAFETMGKEKEKNSFQLKVPKGTKDWEGKDMVIRDKIFGNITDVFKRHGAVTIDTWVNALCSDDVLF